MVRWDYIIDLVSCLYLINSFLVLAQVRKILKVILLSQARRAAPSKWCDCRNTCVSGNDDGVDDDTAVLDEMQEPMTVALCYWG